MKIRVKWRDGSVEFELRDEILYTRFLNLYIELRPRSIIVGGPSDYRVASNGKKKYVYIYLPQEAKPLPLQPTLRLRDIDEFVIGNYTIRYTRARIDEYYTIIVPGQHMYDYLVVTSDEIGVVVPGKRELYFDKNNSTLTIYLV